MALGKLASAMSVEGGNAVLYIAPEAKMAVATVTVCNTGDEDAECSIAVALQDEPGESDWIEYALPLRPSEGIERASIMLGPGNRIIVGSDKATLAINIFGWERDAS